MPVGLLPWRSAPAQGYGEQACGVPNGRLGSDLDRALSGPVPVGDLGHLPNGVWVFGHLGKVGQTLALETGPSPLSRMVHGRGLVEGGIQGSYTNNITPTHLRSLLFTKFSWVEHTGSR